MELRITKKFADRLFKHKPFIKKKTGDDIQYKVGVEKSIKHIKEAFRYGFYNDDRVVEISAFPIDKKVLAEMKKLAKKHHADPGNNYLIQQINQWESIKASPDGGVPKLSKGMKSMIETWVNTTENRFLFKQDADGNMLPYLVHDVEFRKSHQEDGEKIPASCIVRLKYVDMDDVRNSSITWTNVQLRENSGSDNPKTLKELFADRGFSLESKKLVKDYTKMMKDFSKKVSDIGGQYIATGYAKRYIVDKENRDWYWGSYTGESGWISMNVEGEGSMVIVDDKEAETEGRKRDKRSNFASYRDHWWDPSSSDTAHADFDEVQIPQHPYVMVFHKEKHHHFKIHCKNIRKYKYDPSVKDKLVLPDQIKDLIDVLVESDGEIVEDIIAGKTGGIIVACTGEPGLGKTLTAEVYSEVIGKPLYSVQSSQLGIDVEELESNLKKILDRAARWKAILLIDEADVYVRKRGSDIVQNAVVGTFLRVLEYYKGILFFTSNLGHVVDDAIMSRCTAHIKYEKPDKESVAKIWKILSNQYNVKLSDNMIKDLVQTFKGISGRDIKSILKLTSIISNKRKVDVNLDLIVYAARFKNIFPHSEDCDNGKPLHTSS